MARILAYGILPLCLALPVCAQTVYVRGKVTNAARTPLANVTVELVRANLKATTGADGLYSLGQSTAIGLRASDAGEMRMDRGVLELRVARAAPLRIEVSDVKGRVLERSVMDRAAPGTYRLDLAGKTYGNFLHVVKASIGRRSKVFPVTCNTLIVTIDWALATEGYALTLTPN